MSKYEIVPPKPWRTLFAKGNDKFAVAAMFNKGHWGIGIELWWGVVDVYIGPFAFVIGFVRVWSDRNEH